MNTSSKIVIGVVAALALVLTLAIVASASSVAPASAQGNMSTAGKIMVGKAANMTNATGGGMAGNMTK